MLSVLGIHLKVSLHRHILGYREYEYEDEGSLILLGNDCRNYMVGFSTRCYQDEVDCFLDKKISQLNKSDLPSTYYYLPKTPFKVTMVGSKVVDEKGDTVMALKNGEIFINESHFEESPHLEKIEIIQPKTKDEKVAEKNSFVVPVTLDRPSTERISSFNKLKLVPRIIDIKLLEISEKEKE